MLVVVEFVVVFLDLGGGGMCISRLIGDRQGARRIPFLGCVGAGIGALILYWE